MSVQPLCQVLHPVLRSPSRPVQMFGDELQRLVADLIDTMHAHDGVGLAAPQIGCLVQVLVADPSRQASTALVVANPRLDLVSGRTAIVEGCLSVPKVWRRIRRSARVRLLGQNTKGQPLKLEAEGLLAVVLQHEFDHLHGRLFIDRLPWYRRPVWSLRSRSPRRASDAQPVAYQV